MKTVKGEYKNGVVNLLEEVPETMSKKVLITFLEDDDDEQALVRRITLQQPTRFLRQYLSNEREDLYQEFLSKEDNNRYLLYKQLQKESILTRDESMEVLKEFERPEDED